MQETGKMLPIDRHGHSIEPSFAVDLDEVIEGGSNLTRSTVDSPLNVWFARNIARLLECNRCYVAILSPDNGERIDEVKIGCPIVESVPEATVLLIASQLGMQDSCMFQSVASANGFARRLIGWESTLCRHCVIGRIQSHSGSVALFVAGWRRMSLSTAEFVSVTRAIDLTWDAAADFAQMRVQQQRSWLEEIVPPAFVVDENLVVRNMNAGFRQFLGSCGVLAVENGVISGSSPSITACLKEAVHRTVRSDPTQRGHGSTVRLSNDGQKFSFAVIGAIPGAGDPELALIFVPQFDERAGARRIAAAFNLSWVEEQIVSRILRGRCPRVIGTELGFTEETVRTYIKRIMLKIGINRQSEFFVLHSLTFSPFKMRQQDHHVPVMPNRSQIHARDLRDKAS